MKRSYSSENAEERERLEALAARLTDEDLDRRLPSGMTIAECLCHLAFWDAYCLAVHEQWERAEFPPPGSDFEATNSALRAIVSAVPSRVAPELAVSSARSVDMHVRDLDPVIVAAIEEAGRDRLLHRAPHRRGHLDQIERALDETANAQNG